MRRSLPFAARGFRPRKRFHSVERGGRVQRGDGEAVPARPGSPARRRASRGPARAGGPCGTGPGPGDAARAAGGSGPARPARSGSAARIRSQRLGVGLAVGAGAVDPHLPHRHRTSPVDVRDTIRAGAAERVEQPVAGAPRRRRGAPASGVGVERGRAAARARSAATTGPTRRRSSSAGSVSTTTRHRSGLARARPNASTTSSSRCAGRRRRPTRPITSARSRRSSRRRVELGRAGRRRPPPRPGGRGARPPPRVPWAASATSRATPRALAAVTLRSLGLVHPRTVQESAQIRRGTLTSGGALSYPAASTAGPVGVCSLAALAREQFRP